MRYLMLALMMFLGIVCRGQKRDPDDMPDRQQFADIGDLKLESGKTIRNCLIGYRTYGRLNNKSDNAVLFPTWFGGDSKDIEQYARPWQVIDTNRYFLIIADALGNGVSTSPSNSQLQHGKLFPQFTIKDMVESQHKMLTKKMGIKHLHAILGISMGGSQVFQWAVSYPEFSPRLIPIVGTPQPTSYDLMGDNILRKIIESDSAFNHGNYKTNPIIPAATMMLEYSATTPEHKARVMSRDSFAFWQRHIDTAGALDWNDTYYQLKAIIKHDITRDYEGSLKKTATHVTARMLIIASRQDHMVNPLPAMAFARLLSAKLVILNSDRGHQAPNFADEELRKNIRAMLNDLQ